MSAPLLGPQPLPAALGPYVTGLVAYDGVGEPGVHRGLPSTSLTVVLPVDEPVVVGWAGAGVGPGRWSVVAGLHAAPVAVHHGRRQRGLQLSLTVAGARALLGVPAAALAGEIVTLEDVGRLEVLPEVVHDAPGPAEAVPAVVAHLLGALGALGDGTARRGHAGLGRSLALLTRGAGVQETADEVGYGRRHLGALVRSETGLAPRTITRIARFERALGLLRSPAPVTLGEVAAGAGYADQSHLTREWRALAGCPPSVWRREELPNVQDAAVQQG